MGVIPTQATAFDSRRFFDIEQAKIAVDDDNIMDIMEALSLFYQDEGQEILEIVQQAFGVNNGRV